MVLKLLLGDREVVGVNVAGVPRAWTTRKEFAFTWLFVVVPEGDSEVSIDFQRSTQVE